VFRKTSLSNFYTENFVNLKSRTKVTGAFERPTTEYEIVHVSPVSASTMPFAAAEQDLGVNEVAVAVVTRDVGTLINERYGEVSIALNFDIINLMFEASHA